VVNLGCCSGQYCKPCSHRLSKCAICCESIKPELTEEEIEELVVPLDDMEALIRMYETMLEIDSIAFIQAGISDTERVVFQECKLKIEHKSIPLIYRLKKIQSVSSANR